jgi:vancomycin permeability regulator SanA
MAELAGVSSILVVLSAPAIVWTRIRRAATRRAEQPAELIVVLGAALWDGRPCPELRRRVGHAAALYRRGLGEAVLCSGGWSGGRSEAAAMRDELVRRGVPAGAIAIDETGTSTRRSARAVARLGGGRRALFVSSGYHVHRVVSEARRHGIDAIAAPVPERRRAARQEAREVVAVLAYALTARIAWP